MQGLLDKTEPEQIQRGIMMKVRIVSLWQVLQACDCSKMIFNEFLTCRLTKAGQLWQVLSAEH